MDTEEEKARKDLEELENRNVHPLAALAFGVVFVVFICGSTTYLRTHLQLPAQDFATTASDSLWFHIWYHVFCRDVLLLGIF